MRLNGSCRNFDCALIISVSSPGPAIISEVCPHPNVIISVTYRKPFIYNFTVHHYSALHPFFDFSFPLYCFWPTETRTSVINVETRSGHGLESGWRRSQIGPVGFGLWTNGLYLLPRPWRWSLTTGYARCNVMIISNLSHHLNGSLAQVQQTCPLIDFEVLSNLNLSLLNSVLFARFYWPPFPYCLQFSIFGRAFLILYCPLRPEQRNGYGVSPTGFRWNFLCSANGMCPYLDRYGVDSWQQLVF